jgi:hypothetical protein
MQTGNMSRAPRARIEAHGDPRRRRGESADPERMRRGNPEGLRMTTGGVVQQPKAAVLPPRRKPWGLELSQAGPGL